VPLPFRHRGSVVMELYDSGDDCRSRVVSDDVASETVDFKSFAPLLKPNSGVVEWPAIRAGYKGSFGSTG